MGLLTITSFLQSPENKEIASSLVPLIVSTLLFLTGVFLLLLSFCWKAVVKTNRTLGRPIKEIKAPKETLQIVLNPRSRLRNYFSRKFLSSDQKGNGHVEINHLRKVIEALEVECGKLREQNGSLLTRMGTKDTELARLSDHNRDQEDSLGTADMRLVRAQQRAHQLENQMNEITAFIEKLYSNKAQIEEFKKLRAGFGHHEEIEK